MNIKDHVRKLRSPVEIGAFAAGMAMVPWLPRRSVVRLAAALGAAAYRMDGRSRRIAQANLRLALPGINAAGRENAVVRAAFQTMALTYLDLFWFARHSAARLRKHVAFDPSFNVIFRQSPVIAVCAHFGNWEAIGQAASLAGAPAVSVASPMRDKTLDRWLCGLRTRTGQQIVAREGAARRLLRALRNDQLVALLLDQNTRLSEGGIWMDFFGLPVPVSGIVELLAGRTGAAVVPVYGYPLANGDYRAVAGPVMSAADTGDDPGALTVALMHDLETRIRERPELWLWMYKRWKYIPPGMDSARYPFYAK